MRWYEFCSRYYVTSLLQRKWCEWSEILCFISQGLMVGTDTGGEGGGGGGVGRKGGLAAWYI